MGISDELEESTDTDGHNVVWRGWYKFDHIFMKPILTHKGPPLTQSCPSWCHRVAQCFTTPEAYATSNDYNNEDQEVNKNINHVVKNVVNRANSSLCSFLTLPQTPIQTFSFEAHGIFEF